MAIERCLQKSFKDSLEDIKERMKEKRNKKWAKLGKTNQILSAKGKITDDSSTQLKSCQSNNRALAVALEEEKRKRREAEDIILHLKREYQYQKFQVFTLQQKLETQQEQEHTATKLMALKKVILKVFQDLLSAAKLIGLADDQHTAILSQILHASDLEECDSNRSRNEDSLTHLRQRLFVDDDRNMSLLATSESKTGWQYGSKDDHWNCENRYTSLKEKDRQVGNYLPRSVSIRRHCLKAKAQTEQSVSDSMGITKQITDPYQQGETKSEKDLGERNEEMYLCQENICDMNIDQTHEQSNVLTESDTLAEVPKQTDFKSAGSSKAPRERGQKRKLDIIKTGDSLSKSRFRKEKSHSEQHCSKDKTDISIHYSDAYDFVCKESVHVTPFRQNKENENGTTDTNYVQESETGSSESFISDDDSDDSLYMPYSKKSKPRKSLTCKTDVSPIQKRPRLRRAVCEQHNNRTDERNRKNRELEKSFHENPIRSPCKNTEQSTFVARGDSGPNVSVTTDVEVPCSARTEMDKDTDCNENSSEICKLEKDEASVILPKHRIHLGNITNLASSSSNQTRVSHPPLTTEVKYTSDSRRRCTLSVSYKEPSISRKLRRGDPFTDTGFLNSPIFKEKKNSKCKSVKKKSLSRYNEAFVGCN